MEAWRQYEISATEYLCRKFGQYAKFYQEGSANSTISDIRVSTYNGAYFYIEAKQSPAQCGQFVLIPNDEACEFEFSSRNKNNQNEYSDAIIQFMNQQFHYFRDAGTAGKAINMPNGNEIFREWIISCNESKGVRYFISGSYEIIPIEEISRFFNVSAIYRIKRSGSQDVGLKNLSAVSEYINDNYNNSLVREQGAKLYVETDNDIHNEKFIVYGNEYATTRRSSAYEVRKLSNTFNANVIFSIQLKNNERGLSDQEFINDLVTL